MSELPDPGRSKAELGGVLLTGAAFVLGVAADVQALLPLRPPGGVILLVALAICGLALTQPIRRANALLAAMTALVFATLRSAPTRPSTA